MDFFNKDIIETFHRFLSYNDLKNFNNFLMDKLNNKYLQNKYIFDEIYGDLINEDLHSKLLNIKIRTKLRIPFFMVFDTD